MKSLVFARIDSTILYVGSNTAPTDADWDAYITFLSGLLAAKISPNILVVTEGSGPTSAQRQKLVLVTKKFEQPAKVAVVTSSAVARGVVTAMSWFAPVYRSFSPDEMDAALAFLKVPSLSMPAVRAKLRELNIELARG